jgi:very-short-patch-repair endonuclease
MGEIKMPALIQKRAQDLRKNMTVAEKKLWNQLRQRQLGGFRFRRQVPFGNYIVDFACFEPKVIIELDGSQHVQQINYDVKRTKYLEMLGYKVLRFWNNEVISEIDAVLQTIWNNCIPPSGLSATFPLRGRRPN